jgi:hypothetical protein
LLRGPRVNGPLRESSDARQDLVRRARLEQEARDYLFNS